MKSAYYLYIPMLDSGGEMTPCIIKINQLPKFSHFKLAGVIGIDLHSLHVCHCVYMSETKSIHGAKYCEDLIQIKQMIHFVRESTEKQADKTTTPVISHGTVFCVVVLISQPIKSRGAKPLEIGFKSGLLFDHSLHCPLTSHSLKKKKKNMYLSFFIYWICLCSDDHYPFDMSSYSSILIVTEPILPYMTTDKIVLYDFSPEKLPLSFICQGYVIQLVQFISAQIN